MFSDKNMYEAKVFLRALADAHNNLRQVAQREAQLNQYQRQADSLQQAVQAQQVKVVGDQVVKGPNFEKSREVRLFRFTNQVFKDYFRGYEDYNGDFQGLKKLVNDGLAKLSSHQ